MNFPGITHEQLDGLLQIAVGALADIGWSDDMTLKLAGTKAKRVYGEITKITEAALLKAEIRHAPDAQ